MGLFDAIGGFLGGDAVEAAVAAGQEYTMGPWNEAWEDLFGEGGTQEQVLGEYQTMYQDMIDFFDAGATQAVDELRLSQAQEMGFLETGKEATLEQVARGFEQSRGSTMAQNIMGGLANTSWGQQSLGAVDVEAGLAAANVETSYADRIAQTTARHGQEMGQMQQWRVGGSTSARGAYAEGLAGLRGQWADRRVLVEEYGAGLRSEWGSRGASARQSSVGMGQMVVGGLLGGFGF